MLGAFAYWNSDDAKVFESDFFQKWSRAIPGLVIFSKDDVAAVLNRHMPEYVDMFLDIAIPSPQSDVCRFAMLYEFGGLYTDCHFGFDDTLALQSFFSVCHRHQVVVVENGLFRHIRLPEHQLLISGFMFAQPRHPLIFDCLKMVCENLERVRHDERALGRVDYDIWKICGPWILNVALYENVGFDAPDPRVNAWPKENIPIIKDEYRQDVCVVKEEDLPVVRNIYKKYNKPGTHWSERQNSEFLFLSNQP